MDERIEWQLAWLEEAVARVVREMTVLAGMVASSPDLIAPLEEAALVLDKRLRALREALGPREVALEVEVAAARIPAAEISPTAAALTKSKPRRREKREAEEDRPQAGQDPPRPGNGRL